MAAAHVFGANAARTFASPKDTRDLVHVNIRYTLTYLACPVGRVRSTVSLWRTNGANLDASGFARIADNLGSANAQKWFHRVHYD